MNDNPLDALIDDVKARPVPYAVVAAIGVAGALVLASRAAAPAGAIDRVRTAVDKRIEDEPSLGERTRDIASAAGVSQGTMAVMLGSLLSKAVTGFMQLRAEQSARQRSTSVAGTHDYPADEPLDELTVAELREIASEREVSGRSSMNKDELLDALSSS